MRACWIYWWKMEISGRPERNGITSHADNKSYATKEVIASLRSKVQILEKQLEEGVQCVLHITRSEMTHELLYYLFISVGFLIQRPY